MPCDQLWELHADLDSLALAACVSCASIALMQHQLTHKGSISGGKATDVLTYSAAAGLAMQVEDDSAASTSQQQAQLLQESYTSVTAALEQVVMHGELLTGHLLAVHRLLQNPHSILQQSHA